MVVERQIGLRNYIEGGIPLDATVTYDLMGRSSSRDHPCTMARRSCRVIGWPAAACFLPLSVNPRVSRELGTRHRAAIGLTEENDAVAIVVSEETGIISLAIAGDLERRLTADTLRIRLRALLGGRRGARIKPVKSRGALV
jgi:diadenylate cyclase